MERYLVLEDRASFADGSFGAETISTGELAAQTSNSGYQGVLTDLTNAGKILVFTTPMIGTTGIDSIGHETVDPSVRGVICNEIATHISDSPNFQELDYFLKERKVPAISSVGIHAFAHKISNQNKIKASIMDTGDKHAFDQIGALVLLKNRTTAIFIPNSYAVSNIGKTITVVDLGLKHSMFRELPLHKVDIIVAPHNSKPRDILNLKPDGLVISSGPGTATGVKKGLAPFSDEFYGKLPILGVGLGFLAICDYLNIELIDLPKPFNGVNCPVILQNSNTIWQTVMNIPQLALSENNGANFTETYYDLHSDSLAGFYLKDKEVLVTALNPEGAPGSFDGLKVFGQFIRLMEK